MFRKCLALALALAVAVCGTAVRSEEVRFLGQFRWAGDATDLSGLTDSLEGIPHNRLGGFSGIEYLGHDNLFAVLSDRGPRDGAVPFRCRYHVVQIEAREMAGSGSANVSGKLVSTHLLTNESGTVFLGALTALDAEVPAKSLRLDPEAIRLDANRNFVISDEYGPQLLRVGPDGKLLARLPVPRRFTVQRPGSTPDEEATANRTGRQPNGGFEAICLSPNRDIILAMVQRPLLQDSSPGPAGKRPGRNLRLLRQEPNGESVEFVYALEHPRHGVNEMLTVNETSALVLERDSEGGAKAKAKRIFIIDWSQATDVSAIEQLPSDQLPATITPVRKELFIDLLDPKFGLVGGDCPEKFEGLALGPRLADGSQLLVVAVDNDFEAQTPSVLMLFGVNL